MMIKCLLMMSTKSPLLQQQPSGRCLGEPIDSSHPNPSGIPSSSIIWRMELIRDLFGEALLLLALLALKVYGPPTEEEETSETYLDLAIITAPIKELDFCRDSEVYEI